MEHFRFTFRAPSRTVQIFTTCTPVGGGCVFTLDGAAYADLVPFARGTAAVVWDVAGVNGTTPGVVGVSPPQHLSFTEQDIIGGLYYWNTAGTVMRFDYGFPNAPAQTYLTGAKQNVCSSAGAALATTDFNSKLMTFVGTASAAEASLRAAYACVDSAFGSLFLQA